MMPLLKSKPAFQGILMALAGLGCLPLSFAAEQPVKSNNSFPVLIAPERSSDPDINFKVIFDGKTLQGWEGDSTYWRVVGGEIVGETTAENAPKTSSFLIWGGGRPANFELKLEYKISAKGNSGVQYRSTIMPGTKWVMKGYQFDIDGPEWGKWFFGLWHPEEAKNLQRVSGQIFEEEGRTLLALPGQFCRADTSKRQWVVASLGEPGELAALLKDHDWNSIHLIARGNEIIQIVNGRVMAVFIDDDTAKRRTEGLMGLQVHPGDPMKVEFRNIRLKTL